VGIDTQGMSGPVDPNYNRKSEVKIQPHKPMTITPRRLFTPEMVKEAKILINEVLNEREYQRKLKMAHDDPTPPGVSYFDVEHFKHYINEDEPEYNP
tara:strand:- start:84 stop:374 length:291 start_codon:yes stop_codon:yes gene_type:complete